MARDHQGGGPSLDLQLLFEPTEHAQLKNPILGHDGGAETDKQRNLYLPWEAGGLLF